MGLTLTDTKYFLATLSSAMLIDPTPKYVFDQFASKEIDFGKSKGDTVYLNRYPHLGDVGLTESLRAISESSTIGTADPVNLTAEQVTVTLKEYGGPYNSTASKIAPLGITEKVAMRAQNKLIDSKNPADFFNSIGGMILKDDHDRLHDRILCNLLLTSTNKLNPDGVADGSTATTSTGSKLDTADLQTIKETLQSNDAPTFSDGLYYAVISSRMEKHLKQDTSFREAMYYANPNSLLRGEIGVYEGFRFFSSNNIPTATINALTAYQGLFFGDSSVGYGEGDMPVEVRLNKNDDYARFMYLVWLVYRGYALLDESFVVKARTFAA